MYPSDGRDVRGVVHQQCKSLLNHVESTGGSRLGRVDSREVMEIPCWGVEIFRLEQSRGTRKMIDILWNLVGFRFLRWNLVGFRFLYVSLVLDIALHFAKIPSNEEGNKGFV